MPQTAVSVQAQAEPHLNDNGGQSNSPESNPSDHYVQQFDARGHPINPTARYSTRALIRAQNDVLATVGVCVGATDATGLIPRREDKKARERVEAASHENQVGLICLALDVVVVSLATCVVTGLRYRLQIYPMLSQLSLVEMMKLQIKQFGFLPFLFAGLPAYTVQTMGYMARGVLLSHLQRWVSKKGGSDDDSEKPDGRMKLLHAFLYAILRFIPWLCLTSLGVYGELQQLFLLPPYPPLPGRSFLAQFLSMLSPQGFLRPERFSLGTLKQWSTLLLQSPFTLEFVYSQINGFVDSQLSTIIRLGLPRIGNPDRYSVTAAKVDGLNEGLLETLEYDSDDEELNHPWLFNVAEYFHEKWQWLVGDHPVDQTISNEDNQATVETIGQNNSEIQSASQPQVEPSSGPHEITPTVASTMHPIDNRHDTGRPTPSNPEDSTTSSDESPAGPSGEAFGLSHHRGHYRGASVARINPIPNRMTQNEAVPSTPNNPNPSEPPIQYPPQSRSSDEGPKHRITCLSLYPLNALTTHLSTQLATLITLPIETYVIRRMVGSFVATGGLPWIFATASPSSLSPFSLPPGIGNSTFLQTFTYPRRLFLRILQCMAVELVTGCVVVVVGSGGIIRYGIRYFGWRRPSN